MDSINTILNNVDNISPSTSQLCAPEDCKTLIKYPANKLKILTQNIRSVSCNFTGFLLLLSRIEICPDIIVLTECWLTSNANIPQITGYTSYCTAQLKNKNDGVIIYHKNRLKCELTEPSICDATCLVTKINNNTILISIYRSPSFQNIANFMKSLEELLLNYKNYKNVIITGDLNINILNDVFDYNASQYLDLLAVYGILPAHTFPTRDKNCLDHFMLRSTYECQTLIIQNSLTDHHTILLAMDTRQPRLCSSRVVVKVNYIEIANSLKQIDFSNIYNTNDCNLAAKFFIDILSQIVFRNTIKTLTPCKMTFRKPWMTAGLLRCVRNRDSMHLKLRSQPKNKVLQITYKRYRNYCKTLLKKAKSMFEHKRLEAASQSRNIKKTWEVINEITNYKTTPKLSLDLLEVCKSPIEAVDTANRYFGNVGINLANNIISDNDLLDKSPYISPVNSMVMTDVDVFEIISIINSLKPNCSVGWDNISSNVLLQNRESLAPVLVYLINLSIQTGVFPIVFKHALIVPIHKAGDKKVVGNYRPISLLTTVSKVFERVINKRLVTYLEKNNLLSPNQFGFRKNKSTSEAVQKLCQFIASSLDMKKKCLAIFLDLAKAFDTVSIPLLLLKLENLGIRGTQLKLFEDYLSARTQSVRIGEYTSSPITVTCGIPQGSILGPTLFLVYINELCSMPIQNGCVLTYADDTAIVVQGDSWVGVYQAAQSFFNTVSSWLRHNKLTLNVDKTKYVAFSMKCPNIPDAFLLQGHKSAKCQDKVTGTVTCTCSAIQRAETIKYLGITIDERLSFAPYTRVLSQRIRRLTAVFKSIRDSAEPDVIRMLYFSLCQSLITYCITSWGGTNKTHVLPLERAQRGILKCSTNRPYRYPTSDLYKECQVLTVRQLYILNLILYQHSLTKFVPNKFLNKRSSYNVCVVPKTKTSFAAKFPNFLGPYIYNKINKTIHIYSHTSHECKRLLFDMLSKLSYSDTEILIEQLK